MERDWVREPGGQMYRVGVFHVKHAFVERLFLNWENLPQDHWNWEDFPQVC